MNNSEKVSPPSKPDISEEMVSRWQTIANLMPRIGSRSAKQQCWPGCLLPRR